MNRGLLLLQRVLAFREAGLVAVIVVLALVISLLGGTNSARVRAGIDATGQPVFVDRTQNKFLNADTLLTLMKESSFIAIMAIGATMAIILAGIDLSVGSTYALSAVAGALVFHHLGTYEVFSGTAHAGLPFWQVATLGVGACLGTGFLCGFLNGGMVTLLRMHPFIITLGTMAIFRGIAFVVTKGQAVTPYPPELQGIVRWDIGPPLNMGTGLFPVPLGILAVVAIAAEIFLRKTVAGRHIYATGGSAEAARCSGIRTGRVTVAVFTVAGGLAGLSALILLGYYGSASSDTGMGYELDVIAAAVVGGASLSGGRGSALGAVLGAVLIKMIDMGIVILGIDQNYSRIIIGAVIILAVGLDQVNQWLMKSRAIPAVQQGGA